MIRLFSLLLLILTLTGCTLPGAGGTTVLKEDIVILGGGFDGCAAARSAAVAEPEKQVLLVVNDPVAELGGLGTVGAQNFTDIRNWQGQVVTQGSFGRWLARAGQFYDPDRMSEILKEDLAQFPNIKISYGYDLESLVMEQDLIKEINLRNIQRNQEGYIVWGEERKRVKGKVFIDASMDGRLTRLAGNSVTVGRADWPEEYLPNEEQTTVARQQAATLMFQVTGVKTPPKVSRIGGWEFVRDNKGSWGIAGGKDVFTSDQVVIDFNNEFGPLGFALKPLNAAATGKDSDTWWINCLLIFNVDGRAHQRDMGTALYPTAMLPYYINTDQAWVKAREFLQKPEFIDVFRRFQVQDSNTGQWYGFGQAELVRDQNDLPVVGQVMYIRESVHSPLTENAANAQENKDFAITTREAQLAGPGPDGADGENYPTRIGLGYYMMDINAFIPEDLTAAGPYVWPVTDHLRPDWQREGGQPKNPVYLPLEALFPTKTTNLLVPGYATGISSFAWAELRVLPNLAVLGDAAGVAAVRSLNTKKHPGEFNTEDVAWVQEKLKQFGARLDK